MLNVNEINRSLLTKSNRSLLTMFPDEAYTKAFEQYKSELGFNDLFAKERLEILFDSKDFRGSTSPFESTFKQTEINDEEKRRRYNNIIDTMVIESIFDNLKDYTITKMLALDYMENNSEVVTHVGFIMGLYGPTQHQDIVKYIENEFMLASENMQNDLRKIRDIEARKKAIRQMMHDNAAREKARRMIDQVAGQARKMQNATIEAAQQAKEKVAKHGAKNKQDSNPRKGVKMRKHQKERIPQYRKKPQMRREAWGPTPPPEKTYNSNKPLSDAKQNNPQTRRIRRSHSTHAKFYDNDKTNF